MCVCVCVTFLFAPVLDEVRVSCRLRSRFGRSSLSREDVAAFNPKDFTI